MSWQNGRTVLSSYLKMIVVNVLLIICKCNHSVVHTEFMVVFFFCFGFETYLFNFGSLFDFNIGFFYLECTKKILILSHSIHTHHMRLLYSISFPFSSILRHIHGLHNLERKKSIPFLMRLCIYHIEEETKKKNQNEIQTRYFTIILTAIWRSIDVVNCCSNDLSNLLFFFSSFFSLFFYECDLCVCKTTKYYPSCTKKKLRQIYDSFHFLFSHFFSKTIKCVYFSI